MAGMLRPISLGARAALPSSHRLSLRLFTKPNVTYTASQTFHGRRQLSQSTPSSEMSVIEWNKDETPHKVRVCPEGLLFLSEELDKASLYRVVLPNFWLRDNCRCASCVNQDTMQRNFNTFAIPTDITPVHAVSNEKGVKVTWSHEDHVSHYTWRFINYYLRNNHRFSDAFSYRQLWGADIKKDLPTVTYEQVMDTQSDNGIAHLTRLIMRHGLAFVEGTPFDDAQHTKKLLERIAFIRETHYGGFYDFIPDLAKADTAYTNLALPAHTDTTYFTDPAGLQAFHLLSHTPPPSAAKGAVATGGESLLVDGFNAANILRDEDPRAYRTLMDVKLPWHASGNKGITIAPDRNYPVFDQLISATSQARHLRIRWNNDDRGVVPFHKGKDPNMWYAAARKWDEILRRKENELWVQLEPGRTLIFDNSRVLHGRSAFEGIRRICGGYINRDDFVSRWRNLNADRETLLEQVIG